jgi:polysaccharide export outer membrane protein
MEGAMHRAKFLIPLFFLAVAVAPVSLFGQRNDAATPASTAGPQADALGNPTSSHPDLQKRNPRYRVAASDTLSVTFPLSDELDQPTVMVQPDGYITLQGINNVYVQGLTVPEIVETLKKAYAGILHDPIITVDLVDFQRPFFLVSGQVGKPGQYDLRHDTTVSEAIAMAGGFAPTAKTQVFLYHRVSSNWVEVKELKLNDILHGKNVNEDAQLSTGDMIFVPEKFITNFRKYVPYALTGVGGSYINP